MPVKRKIRIADNSRLREALESVYEEAERIPSAQWALATAKRALDAAGIDYHAVDELADGFRVNELWQAGEAGVHDLRQAGFRIHRLARNCRSEVERAAMRAAGHAVGSGHMREHAMVASDYAVQTVGLLTSNDFVAVTAEREWQISELRQILGLWRP